ncbi:Unknown protein [Striga hermonthica]|uniref:Uncharacterized protein n=1 Tax=Striga hermonthica TaxID=68872 RepID=A0A9N7NSJ0_STRHE|nr:Unknown protein [Striga hermonthica]
MPLDHIRSINQRCQIKLIAPSEKDTVATVAGLLEKYTAVVARVVEHVLADAPIPPARACPHTAQSPFRLSAFCLPHVVTN